jgi:triosephosphate isomerase
MALKPLLIVGNWKMFGRMADLAELDALADAAAALRDGVELAVCPPFTLTAAAAARAAGKGRVAIGVQDVAAVGGDGAHTGEVSAAMAADAGARFAIVGHSERRAGQGETDAMVAAKAQAALDAGLAPIVCVGETLEERTAGRAEVVVAAQVAASCPAAELVVAYEPVWAIGTGLTPTGEEIVAIHAAVRAAFAERFGGAAVRVLYGGSVKPTNAAEILALAGVDGALVGGASLKAKDFAAIAAAG